MGQALYRKYRSKGFNEVVGQDHVVKTLHNALKSGHISHAYLFTGPRGTGKTSVARILAHEVNNLPYNKESIHLDIIEIDAASNRRIDEIRELRERVHITPTSAKYKVYIIDEVHMLTREAFNALLKTLEEPPAHCIFILATTELHKLPETIVSRTQRFTFQPVNKEVVADHLGKIAKSEKIHIDRDALQLLAEHGGGSLRDSISLLDQLAATGAKINEHKVRDVLGLPTQEAIAMLMTAIENLEPSAALETLTTMKEQGVNPAVVAKELSQQLRDRVVNGRLTPQNIKLLRRLSNVAAASDPQERLEIDIIYAAYSPETANKNISKPLHPPDSAEEESTTHELAPDEQTISEENEKSSDDIIDAEFDLSLWPAVLNKVKVQAASLYTALRLAEPLLEDNKLVLAFQFPLHQKKLTQAKNLDLLGKIIEEVSGSKITITCTVDKTIEKVPAKAAVKSAQSEPDQSFETISNIFGAAEMLES